jgi:hypothetical protein
MSAERADENGTVDLLCSDPHCSRTDVLQHYSLVPVCCCRDQARVNTVSFPLAPGASRWLPALADIPQFKWAQR